MNIKLNTPPGNIVPTAARMQMEKAQKTEPSARSPRRLSDQIFISAEGREAAQAAPLDSAADELTRILDEEPEAVWAAIEAAPQQELEINYVATVDPDHTIWTRAYCDALMEQYKKDEQTIRDYYAGEHAKNSSMPLEDALWYLNHKYLDPYSSFPEFRSDMSRDERLTAYKQERSLLITGRIYTYNDPYALASTGGPTSFFDLEPEARKAADARIEALIREYKQAHGITDE